MWCVKKEHKHKSSRNWSYGIYFSSQKYSTVYIQFNVEHNDFIMMLFSHNMQ